jgi:dolichol-phosphate mannosyltransferase
MRKDLTELSIVIPTRNDESLIGDILGRVREEAEKLNCRFEIIVIDGNSVDATRKIVKERGAFLFCLDHRPTYGEIIHKSVELASGQHVIILDADLLENYTVISRFWERRQASELLIGSRYVSGGSARMPLARKILSRMLNILYGRLLSLPYKDISSGFRMYNKKIFEDVRPDAFDYSILIESILKAHANGWIIEEIPFRYEPERFGHSTKRAFSFLLTTLRSIFRMWQLRNSVFSADYDERAFNSMIPLQRYWHHTRYKIIMSSLNKEGCILDIGCGSSRIIQQLKGAVGLDISLKKQRYLRRRGILLVKADINRLPFKDASYSTVICSQVIEHVPVNDDIYKEIHRVLEPGGILAIGTPDYGRVSWRILEYIYGKVLPGAYAEQHITHYTRSSLTQMLRKHGFEVIQSSYVGKSELIMKARTLSAVSCPSE